MKDNKNKRTLVRFFPAVMAVLLLLSSCKIEMRDSTGTDAQSEAEESAALMLSQATKKNSIETAPETEAKAEMTERKDAVSFAVCGNIVMDESIIKDAANRAVEGKSYSFLKMYTGVYNIVNSADAAVCTYSTTYNEDGEPVASPIESIGAIYDLGIDIVNTDSETGISEYLGEYELDGLFPGSDAVIIEKNGLNIACVTFAAGDEDYSAAIEYADLVSDMVIAFVDWTDSMTDEEMRAETVKIAEAGADIVVGNGRTLGGVEWLDTNDGTKTLAVYSLGCLLATSDDVSGLCGGILSFSVVSGGGSIEIDDVSVTPTLVHYTADEDGEPTGYQVFTFDSYKDELASGHAVSDFTTEGLSAYIRRKIKTDFLPEYLAQ